MTFFCEKNQVIVSVQSLLYDPVWLSLEQYFLPIICTVEGLGLLRRTDTSPCEVRYGVLRETGPSTVSKTKQANEAMLQEGKTECILALWAMDLVCLWHLFFTGGIVWSISGQATNTVP